MRCERSAASRVDPRADRPSAHVTALLSSAVTWPLLLASGRQRKLPTGGCLISRNLFLSNLAAVSLSLAACGSSSSHSSKPRTGVHGHIYHVMLSGTAEKPPGAAKGSGAAVIALHSNLTVCWRFSHLHGFTDATVAHIHRGAAGTSGPIVVPLSTGPKLHHKGCVPTTAATIKTIERDPSGYYVNIHSKQYPGGAVRAQL